MRIPQHIAEWLMANSPEIAELGGPDAVPTHVVDRLPFLFTPSEYAGQVWDGEIYLKKSWVEQFTNDLSVLPIDPEHRVLKLWLHEWGHVVSQKNYWGPFWCWLLFHYALGHRKEERKANEFRDRLYLKWTQRGI